MKWMFSHVQARAARDLEAPVFSQMAPTVCQSNHLEEDVYKLVHDVSRHFVVEYCGHLQFRLKETEQINLTFTIHLFE